MKTNTASLLRKMGLCLFASLLTVAAANAQVIVLYTNNFSSVGANPVADGWQMDTATISSYGSYTAFPVGGDVGFQGLGGWSRNMTTAAFKDSIITMALTLESEDQTIGANGGFGLSSLSATNFNSFTATGPRMMWGALSGTNAGTFTMTGPTEGGSVSTSVFVPSNINNYWRRANLVMELNTTTGIAQGYYSTNSTSRIQVITDFDMKGSLTAAQFNDLFSNGAMQFFGARFDSGSAGRRWVDNINITAQAVPEPSTYALILGGIATLLLIRRRVQS